MRIAVSLLNFRPGRIGGTETYLRELVANLPLVAGSDEIVLVVDRDLAPQLRNAGIQLSVVEAGARSVLAQRFLEATTAYQARAITRTFDTLAPDVALFPQQVIFPIGVSCPAVVVVHDLYHVRLPENLTYLQRLYRTSIYGPSLARADRVIAVSEYTRRSLIEHYGMQEFASRIGMVHHGIRPAVPMDATSLVADESLGPFVYYPAVSHPHKNHLQLFRAVARLHSDGAFPYRLLLSGGKTRHWSKLRREIQRLDLQQVVEHLGFLPASRVQVLYRTASAVVFPSSYEGFGIPIVEAAASGKKIITSDIEAFRELGVPDRFRIDFDDPRALQRALAHDEPMVLECPVQTWEQTTRQTLEIVREAGTDAWPIKRNPAFVPRSEAFAAKAA